MPSPLQALARTPELLQHIVFFACEPLGPPAALFALLATSRDLYARLAPLLDNAYLYARIFHLKFDVAAARRRLGPKAVTSSSLQRELVRRCAALKRIRSGDISSKYLREDLWLAYLMMLENDGRNELHLLDWANIRGFVLEYLGKKLYDGSHLNAGWPLETDENALAVWLLWLTTDAVKLRNEPVLIRRNILDALQPYCVGAFRYATHFIPETHFLLPLFGTPATNPVPTTQTPHGLYPVYRPPLSSLHPTITHFGRPLTMCAPPLVPAALLCCFVRNEAFGLQYADAGYRRADVDQWPEEERWGIATVEDFQEWDRAKTMCVSRVQAVTPVSFMGDEDGSDELDAHARWLKETWWSSEPPRGSMRHEHDWLRMMRCFNPYLDAKLKIRIYTPGMLHGLWEGRMISNDPHQYTELYNRESIPPLSEPSVFPSQFLHAMFANLREHLLLPPKGRNGSDKDKEDSRASTSIPQPEGIQSSPVPTGGDGNGMDGDGVCNAWFPDDAEFIEKMACCFADCSGSASSNYYYHHTLQGQLLVSTPSTGEKAIYETVVPGKPNSHIAAGGCEECRPEVHLSASSLSNTPLKTRARRPRWESQSRSPSRASSSRCTVSLEEDDSGFEYEMEGMNLGYQDAPFDPDRLGAPSHPRSKSSSRSRSRSRSRVEGSSSYQPIDGKEDGEDALVESVPEEWEQIFLEAGVSDFDSDSEDEDEDEDVDVDMEDSETDTEIEAEVQRMDADVVMEGVEPDIARTNRHTPSTPAALPKGKTEQKKVREMDYVRDGCVRDIIVTGETSYNHGRAWGSYKFYGRVRDTDGLIVLIRIPVSIPDHHHHVPPRLPRPPALVWTAGTYIFHGYIHSNLNFVGRWRVAHHDPFSVTNIEGTFTLCKRML